MSLTVTALDIREFCPDLTATDAAIEGIILAVSCKLDTCLEGSYSECLDLARLIKINTICHFAAVTSRKGQIKSRKYANGAAESYSSYNEGGQGLNASEFGEAILILDSAGCVNTAFPQRARQFITTAGSSGSRDVGFYFGESDVR
tara:strand:+ start:24318 stop:24755 length:438 start_codon:yes stop_codon:yes gene_type:complete